MPFDSTDIRSTLTAARPAAPPAQAAAADYLRFHDTAPAVLDGARRWRGRSQNLIIDVVDIDDAGTVLSYPGGPDETGVILTEARTSMRVHVADGAHEIGGETVTFVPPGRVEIEFTAPGRVVVISTTRAPGLADGAMNAAAYVIDHANVAPIVPWPDPVGGFQVRTYDLTVPTLGNPPFRIFRCASFMVNYIAAQKGPRDPAKMSPHDHADFEQLSLVLHGEYIHHLRWPWTTDLTEWRDDEHVHVAAPSLTVIPPPTVHTSQSLGEGFNQLIDIFGPPRRDFSLQEGWVLNAVDYPMPEIGD
jgi:hypothetical protein